MKRSLTVALLLAAAWLAILTLGLPAAARGVTAPDAFYDPTVAAMLAQVTQAQVYSYVAQLSGETPAVIGGEPYTITTRHTNSGLPIQRATQFVYEFMQQQGLGVSYHNWSACGTSGRNVIGVLTGTLKPQEIVLITAHLDDMPSIGAAPGADDNASGSVGVMIAAEILSDHPFERTVRFAFFTGEEQGLCGSDVYAGAVYAAGDNIVAVYNMDMIGWDSTGDPVARLHTRMSGAGYAADLAIAGVFTQVVQAYGLSNSLTPVIDADGEDRSDHSSFWDRGYAAILAIEDDANDFNAYYHTSNDRLQYLNFAYFTAFVKASVGTAAHLARVSLPLAALNGAVTDAITGEPIGGARIDARADVTRSGQTWTDAQGRYALKMLAGTYVVTASAYGYAPLAIEGVTLHSALTTTQDFALNAMTFYTLSGSIRDALIARPVSATITIDGYPHGPIVTDPLDGNYIVRLAEGVTYTLHVSPNVAGYLPADRLIGALTADRVEDFALQPDLAACVAPGYLFTGVRESFTITPTNWLISSGASGAGWRITTSGLGNNTGGSGPYALADSDGTGPGVPMDTALMSPPHDFTGQPSVTLVFKTHFSYYEFGSSEVADVDVSVDGGTWQNVWRRTADYYGPHTEVIDLSSIAAGRALVQVRFHYYNAVWDGWWQVDEVQLGVCRPPRKYRVYAPVTVNGAGQ